MYSLPSDVYISIGSENDPPELSYIGSQETNEDVPLSIEIIATDPDGDDLDFIVESDTSGVEAEIQDGLLTLNPSLNWHGTAMITVTVSDIFSEDSETFELTVHSVNDLPDIDLDGLPQVNFEEDDSLTIDFSEYVNDVDGDELTLEASPSQNLIITIEGLTVTFTTVLNYNGFETITFTVTDGQGEFSYDSDDLLVIVTAVNDAPEFPEIGNQESNEDEVFTYTLIAEDVDGDDLFYNASSLNENIVVRVSGDVLTVTPELNWNGTANIMVTASDGFESDTAYFDLIVNPVNDAPVSDDISLLVPEDTPVLIEVSGSDIDGDSLSFELVDEPLHGGLGPSILFPINASGDGDMQVLTLGFLPFATDGYDDGIDTYAPPAPPPPSFDVALGWEGDRYYTQIVSGSTDDMVAHEWDIYLQYGVDGEILLSWDPSGLDSNYIIEDAFGGLMFSIDMSTQSELVLENPHTSVKVRVTPAEYFEWVYTPEPQ